MRTLFLGRAVSQDLAVDYYLLTEELGASLECYGIRIESGGEQEEILSITSSQTGALSLLSMLMQGLVTPRTARDVVEDWLLQ